MALLLASVFLPVLQVVHHLVLYLRAVELIPVLLVLNSFLGHLLIVHGVMRLVDRMRQRYRLHLCLLSLLSDVQCHLRDVLYFCLNNPLVEGGRGDQAWVKALNTHDKAKSS